MLIKAEILHFCKLQVVKPKRFVLTISHSPRTNKIFSEMGLIILKTYHEQPFETKENTNRYLLN